MATDCYVAAHHLQLEDAARVCLPPVVSLELGLGPLRREGPGELRCGGRRRRVLTEAEHEGGELGAELRVGIRAGDRRHIDAWCWRNFEVVSSGANFRRAEYVASCINSGAERTKKGRRTLSPGVNTGTWLWYEDVMTDALNIHEGTLKLKKLALQRRAA